MTSDISPPLAELDRAGILIRVKQQLVRLLNLESADSMDESTVLAEDLGVDSLGMVDLVIVMEESFQVKMASDTDLTSVRTIGDMTDLLQGMQ